MPSNNKVIYAINKNSLEIYDGVVTKNIKIEYIYNLLKNKENIFELNIKEISKIKKQKMLNNYSKIDILDDILYITNNKFSHLKEIRYLTNLNDLIEYILPDDIFLEKVKINYTNLIIDRLIENYYDYDSIKMFSRMKQELNNLDQKLNIKIIKKITEYYVKKITV